MALLGLAAVTVVAIVAFVRSNHPVNKAGTTLMWAVMGVFAMTGGL